MPDSGTKPVAVYVHRIRERRVSAELKSAAAIAVFLILSIIILVIVWLLSRALVPSISSLPDWADILLTIGMTVLAVVSAGMIMKSFRRKPTMADLQTSKDEMLATLRHRGKHADVASVCSLLVERWLWFNQSAVTFGIDARTRLADVRFVETALSISLPRLYVFSQNALADIHKLDSSDQSDTRPLFSERRFVRQFWLNGLWNFWALPLLLLTVTLRFSSLQISLPVVLAIVAPLFVAVIWWLHHLCKADLRLSIRDHAVSRVDRGVTEPLDPQDVVVVVRRATRPRAFQSYLSEVRWEFTRGSELPLYFAEQFDPKDTAWAGVLDER